MDISRRIYSPTEDRRFTHYRSCVKHVLVEGLLVFSFDSLAIQDKQALKNFLSLLDRISPHPYITCLLNQPDVSVKTVDDTIPHLRSYFGQISVWFYGFYNLDRMDQTIQNCSNVFFYYSLCFKVSLTCFLGDIQVKYPDESVDDSKAWMIILQQDYAYFYYRSLSYNRPISYNLFNLSPVTQVLDLQCKYCCCLLYTSDAADE